MAKKKTIKKSEVTEKPEATDGAEAAEEKPAPKDTKTLKKQYDGTNAAECCKALQGTQFKQDGNRLKVWLADNSVIVLEKT